MRRDLPRRVLRRWSRVRAAAPPSILTRFLDRVLRLQGVARTPRRLS